MPRIRCSLAVLLLISAPLRAQTSTETNAPEVPQTLGQAAAQRARAAQLSREADQRYAAEQEACYKKILVNSCLADAKKSHTQAVIESRKLDAPARDFQREAKRADVDAKETQRAADRPQREAEQKTQAETYRSDEAAKAAEREKKIADKDQKAAAGHQKLAAERAKRQAKLDQRAKKIAARTAKAAKTKPEAPAAVK